MTDHTPLTDEEVATEFSQHRAGSLLGNPLKRYCRACSRTWPCPTARLIADLRANRAEVEKMRESRDKLELAFEYADREARLAIERIKELEKKD